MSSAVFSRGLLLDLAELVSHLLEDLIDKILVGLRRLTARVNHGCDDDVLALLSGQGGNYVMREDRRHLVSLMHLRMQSSGRLL